MLQSDFWVRRSALRFRLAALLPLRLRERLFAYDGWIDAARGMGMTNGQILRQVELPLAAPVIAAGIRTASVWTVGAATLATPVGQMCLGNYIFTGLQTRSWTMLMVGVIAYLIILSIAIPGGRATVSGPIPRVFDPCRASRRSKRATRLSRLVESISHERPRS